jgi:hypothetical protein
MGWIQVGLAVLGICAFAAFWLLAFAGIAISGSGQ